MSSSVAIIGATGLVGGELLTLLEEQESLPFTFKLFASSDSAGELYTLRGEEHVVGELTSDAFEGIDIALFAVTPQVAEQWIPLALEAGATVLDVSSYARSQNAPLWEREMCKSTPVTHGSLYAAPTQLAGFLAPVLRAISARAGIRRVVLSSYESVSGSGRDALDELWEQGLAVYNQKEISTEAFQHQIAFNCIPQVDVMLEDGSSREEQRTANDLRALLAAPELKIAITQVRVPVFHSHSASVTIETKEPLSREECLTVLEEYNGIDVAREVDEYPMPLDLAGSSEIMVGRVRRDPSVENGLMLWAVADTLRTGFPAQAVAFLEHYTKSSE